VNDEQHAIDIDLDGRQRENLAKFHRLYRQDSDRDGARGGMFHIHRAALRPSTDPGKEATRPFH
jgi:hypothetical protein